MAGSENPFADPSEVNPFLDPSIQQAAQEKPPQYDEYNPFVEDPTTKTEDTEPVIPAPPSKEEIKGKNLLEKKKKKEKAKAPERPPDPQPAVLNPTEANAPPTPFHDDMLKKEEELAARERALSEREKAYGVADPRPNNFPPLPAWCPVKPCFYHNIKDEIPPSEQWMMRLILILWGFYVFVLFYNCICCLAALFVIQPEWTPIYGASFGVSIFYLLAWPPISLLCWYMPLYRAYRKDSSLSFMCFFFVFALQIISFGLYAIGFPNFGTSGFWLGGLLFNSANVQPNSGGVVVGAMMIISGFMWAILFVPGAFLLFRIHSYYRRSGMTLEQAQNEALTAAAKNKTVRKAAKQAVVTGTKAAMTE